MQVQSHRNLNICALNRREIKFRANIKSLFKVISFQGIATLMQVNFNYQIDPSPEKPVFDDRFPIIGLLEYQKNELD